MKTRHQRGISLPAMAFALAVVAIILVAITQQRVRAANELAGRSLGATLNELGRAVELYRTTHLATLTGALPVTVAGFADPYAPTTAELQAAGFLAPAVNMPAADYTIALTRSPVGCVAPADDPCTVWSRSSLVAPVLNPDGTVPADRLNALVARITSSNASFSGPPNPATITGGDGTWVIANPDPAARSGIVVLVNGLGGAGEPWLRVGDTRNPDFRGPSVTGTQFDTAHKIPGDACTPQGAFASAANAIVYCNAGIWTVYNGPINVGATACTEEGAMGVTAAGASLICVASLWRDHLTYGFRGVGEYAHGQTVPRPACGVGLAPFAVVSTQGASVIIGTNNPGNNSGSFQSRIDPATWLVEIVGATNVQAGQNARATVTTSCTPV